MPEKICFMQFYEIDITWQMTLTFDFFFCVSSPPFHFPNKYAPKNACRIEKRKIILTFCHRCRLRRHCCYILKDEEKIGH